MKTFAHIISVIRFFLLWPLYTSLELSGCISEIEQIQKSFLKTCWYGLSTPIDSLDNARNQGKIFHFNSKCHLYHSHQVWCFLFCGLLLNEKRNQPLGSRWIVKSLSLLGAQAIVLCITLKSWLDFSLTDPYLVDPPRKRGYRS